MLSREFVRLWEPHVPCSSSSLDMATVVRSTVVIVGGDQPVSLKAPQSLTSVYCCCALSLVFNEVFNPRAGLQTFFHWFFFDKSIYVHIYLRTCLS